jgi:uncharacterized damage-inducible protein DinB
MAATVLPDGRFLRSMDMASELVTAWHMSHAANLHVLEALPEECLEDRYSPRTRTVAGQFAHMHDVRLRWLGHVAPALVGKLEPFTRDAKPDKRRLVRALRASAAALAEYLESCAVAGKVKGWRGPPASFLAYLVAHEAHHRGLAMVAMRIAGHRPGQDLVYGQWDWGKAR